MDTLDLVKYEALGNDFLVLFDLEGVAPFGADLVAALCARHRGVGADGVLRISRSSSATVAMELKNADGSDAETSGNGLRCVALAAVHAGLATSELVIETVAGAVRSTVRDLAGGGGEVSVEMGEAEVESVESPIAARRAFRVDTGNPHLVLIGEHSAAELSSIDLERCGPELEVAVAGGQNVEFVAAGANRGEIAFRVWERGVGITEACGSGSVAAAAASHFAGLSGERVVVENPGGSLVVALGGDPRRPSTTLTGPARRVASLRVVLDDLVLRARL